jgi:hypothetical protein
MKPRVITAEMLEAGKMVVQIARYQAEGTPIPKDYDAEGKARVLFNATGSPEKRIFLRMVRRIIKSNAAEKAAETSGLYSPSGLYAALCDVSEHIMHGQGKEKYRTPAILLTSNEARRSASDIVDVIERTTGFDLMDPAGSLRRMQKKARATA